MRALVLLAFLSASALAQPQPLPQRLYVGSGLVIGSSRMVALGGAYVGIAEGADGFVSNFAAVAHRSPHREGQWDWDAGLSWLVSPAPRLRDHDNDGDLDASSTARELYVSAFVQLGRAGLGTYVRSTTETFALPALPDLLEVDRQLVALTFGLSLARDELVLGGGFIGTVADLAVASEELTYTGANLEGGLLYRPTGQSWRLGATLRYPVMGTISDGRPAVLAGRGSFSGTAAPSLLSIGASFRFGEGAHRYNRLSKAALFEIPREKGKPPPEQKPDDGSPPGRWLLSVQLDVVAPVENATSLSAFTHEGTPRPVGANAYAAPHVGVEHETLVKRLRLRGGAYLEPSPFPGQGSRPHLTGGFQLFLLRLLDDWALAGAFDLAPRYHNVTVGIGFWR